MKLLAATLASLSLLAAASAQADPTQVREDVRMVAPALEKYAQTRCLATCGNVPVSAPATAASLRWPR